MRKVYIVPKGYDRELAEIEAMAHNCPEIAWGIPPRIAKEGITETDLPYVYEEVPVEVVEPRDLLKELDELKDRVKKLEGKGENNADR